VGWAPWFGQSIILGTEYLVIARLVSFHQH